MKKGILKVLILLIMTALIVELFAGCGTKDNQQSSVDIPTTDDKTTEDTNKDKEDEGKGEDTAGGKITDKPITLTWWTGNRASETAATMADTPLFKEVMRITGVNIEFLHPPTGQENEQFNLMIGSGELPDLIERNWITGYPGGPEKAIADGIILDHTEIIEKHAVNLKKYLESHLEVDKAVKTDTKKYYMFPFIRGDDYLMIWFGPQLRKDWLDELNLEVPETVDEWENVLQAFKQKGVEIPLTFQFSNWKSQNNSFIIGAYGACFGFYNDNGTVKYGRIEPGFKEALATLQRWYKEGLLDPDFAAQDTKTFEAKITGEKAGAFIGSMGNNMGRFTTAARQNNPNFTLTAAPWPTLNKGEVCRFGHKDPAVRGDGTSITAKCKEVEIAAKFLDFGYGEIGHMLYNFGIQGESYEMINGYPTYTDIITKNPDGLTMAAALRMYTLSSTNGPIIQDRRYVEQYAQLPEQREALGIWSTWDSSTQLPMLTPTPEESEKFASIMNEINTYVDEMFLKFVMGQVSLDQFDEYVEQVKKMGIDEAIQIQQAALERYNAR